MEAGPVRSLKYVPRFHYVPVDTSAQICPLSPREHEISMHARGAMNVQARAKLATDQTLQKASKGHKYTPAVLRTQQRKDEEQAWPRALSLR